MVTIIIGMALAFIAGVFCSLQSVRLGLKWQIQTTAKQEPTLTIPNPIKEHREAKRASTAHQQTANILDEYLHGAKEGG
jgi:hypothetical protein